MPEFLRCGGAPQSITCRGNPASNNPILRVKQQTLPRHSRKMAYEERDEATSLYTLYMVYMIITQNRCTMALSLAVFQRKDTSVAC